MALSTMTPRGRERVRSALSSAEVAGLLQQLREAIPRERKRSQELKVCAGREAKLRAVDALKHVQIMQKELDNAEAQQQEADAT